MRPDWRLLVDRALPGAANMARDHALAEAASAGAATLRLYRWDPAALSLGRNEPFAAAHRELLRRRPDMGVVRRPTGGRAVIHDRELTYSVAAPARAFGGPRGAYRRIHEALVEGLRTLGVDARAASGRTALPPDSGPCFLEPADGEVVVAGRKVVGSAQVRIGKALLQHGSVLLTSDQSALAAAAARTDPRPRAANGSPPVTLAEILGEAPSWTALADALAAGFASRLGGSWKRGRMDAREEALAAELEARYASDEWTRRR